MTDFPPYAPNGVRLEDTIKDSNRVVWDARERREERIADFGDWLDEKYCPPKWVGRSSTRSSRDENGVHRENLVPFLGLLKRITRLFTLAGASGLISAFSNNVAE